MRMTLERAIGLASEWADGHVNTLRNGEAEAYHEMFLELLEEKKNSGRTKPMEQTATNAERIRELVLCGGREWKLTSAT